VDEWLALLVSSPLGLWPLPSCPWLERLLVQELRLERFLQTFKKLIFKLSKNFELN
jgi:hypothetical protein